MCDGELQFSTRKKLVFSLVTIVVMLMLLESAARIMYYVSHGFNPYYLIFGFVADTQYHSAEGPGYTKFQPNTVYHQNEIDVAINSDGFRHLEHFVKPKPPGVFRVLTMGESSTFGYGNADNETYPFQLQQILRERYPSKESQVYNLGIPHFRTNNILALAKAEVPSLEPDLITLYAGVNNATLTKPRNEAGKVYRLKDWLYFHSVFWRVIHTTVKDLYYSFFRVTQRDLIGLPSIPAPAVLNPQVIALLRSQARQEYRQHLEELANVASQLGSSLMLITQSYALHGVNGSGLQDKWRTYQQEIDKVEQMYGANGHLTGIQTTLLVHWDLMDELRALTKRRNLPLLEGIEALDVNRAQAMASYVHLTPVGNRILAMGIADMIVQEGLIEVLSQFPFEGSGQ